MKKEVLINKNGITLVALVITIIILIILAGVSINLLLKDNGIISKSAYAKEQYTIEGIQEKLELVKGTTYVNEQGSSNIDKYFTCLEEEKINPYKVTNKEKMTDSLGIVEVDEKYSFLIKTEGDNIKIEYEGKVGEINRPESNISIALAGETIQTTIPIEISATITDGENPVNSAKWILNTESEKIGTEEEKYKENLIDANSISLEIDEINTYYLHVLTTDYYGRKTETIQGPITISNNYHTHTGSKSSGGGCYTKANMVTRTYSSTCGSIISSSNGYYYDSGAGHGVIFCSNGHAHGENQQGGVCNATITNTTTVQEGWLENCGKTTATQEGYIVNY